MKGKKTLVAGPWIGEFGWELYAWQAYIRTLSKNFDTTIIISRPNSKVLYEDFADEYIPYTPPPGLSDSFFMYDVDIKNCLYEVASRHHLIFDPNTTLFTPRRIGHPPHTHYKKEVKLIRDPDVLDTWFSSGLWSFATLGWPSKNEYLKKFYPTTVLVTGFDIIFFWVARMMMFGMEFLNKEPFKDIYVHALVRDEKGQKMSKSKGNVIDPLDLIQKYSADALRFTLLSMASPGTDVKLSEDRVKGYRNFLNKLWNANNFLIQNKCNLKNAKKLPKLKVNINKWIYFELLETSKLIKKNIEDYRFDEASKNAYHFAWHKYCDWYLELSKTILFSNNLKAKNEVKEVSAFVFRQILIMLHPFIPFVTEKIWLTNKFDSHNKNFLMNTYEKFLTYLSFRNYL